MPPAAAIWAYTWAGLRFASLPCLRKQNRGSSEALIFSSFYNDAVPWVISHLLRYHPVLIISLAVSLHVTSRGRIPEEKPQTGKCPHSTVSFLMIPLPCPRLSPFLCTLPMFTPSLGDSPPAIPYTWLYSLCALVSLSPGMLGGEQLPHFHPTNPCLSFKTQTQLHSVWSDLWLSRLAAFHLICALLVPSPSPSPLSSPCSLSPLTYSLPLSLIVCECFEGKAILI